ncbi:MAG: hypothetical protein HY562_03935 [Ignavibacteriales bacterium]|nr:hypothetical protein [Ignavibacteriales bacterium]
MDTLFEAWETLKEKEMELKTLRQKARRNPGHEDLLFVRELPEADNKRIRHSHVVLQMICILEEEGIETGDYYFTCERCSKPFAVTTANHDRARDQVDSVLHLGFDDVERMWSEGLSLLSVRCVVRKPW